MHSLQFFNALADNKAMQTLDFPSSEAKTRGFTLAELLIALAILGVVATFTIPKVLQSYGSSQHVSVSKELVGMVSGALESYKASNTITATTKMRDLTPYFNYIQLDTAASVDGVPLASGTISCAAPVDCFRFANGAVLAYDSTQQMDTFGGTDLSTYFLFYAIDPDGTENGVDSLLMLIRPSGLTTSAAGVDGQPFGADPPWFSWD